MAVYIYNGQLAMLSSELTLRFGLGRADRSMTFHKSVPYTKSSTRPRGYKTFLCSAQKSMKFFLLMNVKMPTIVDILTFMSGKKAIKAYLSLQKAEFLNIFLLMSLQNFVLK